MTETERLAKNEKIREKGKETRLKRKNQVCRVFRLKIDFSHLSKKQKTFLKMLFVEAKWLHNDVLTFAKDNDINNYDYKIKNVHVLDKDRKPVTHNIEYLGSQLKQAVIQEIKFNIKSLSALKNNNRKIGQLKYKSDYSSINLTQQGITYKLCDNKRLKIQGLKEKIKIEGTEQFFNNSDIEIANAKLLNLPDGYYLAVTTFQNKGGENKKYKSPIGIDMGIKDSITTSDRRKFKVLIEETERLKKLQRSIAKKEKGSSNRYKTRKLLRIECQKLTNRKLDAANKIVHELLEHEVVYMQDENLKGWHKGLFSKVVQHSILGLVKAKLKQSGRVIVLSKQVPTTKYCPVCGNLKKDIKLSDRIYKCEVCGYSEDRDIHAARNMILLSGKNNTCGTQEINAFGEDRRRLQPARPVEAHSSLN